MNYTIDECDLYMDEKLDKMGSDYFPLPIKLLQFQKATYDLIRESTKFIEANQEISDDIVELLVEGFQRDMTQDVLNLNIWYSQRPDDYIRLITAEPYFLQNSKLEKKFKIVKIVKSGQYRSFKRDPNREPTPEYPLVLRTENKVMFDFGVDDGTVYSKALFSYIKKPTFAEADDSNDRIVNLSDIAIEKILDRTCNALRVIVGDPSATSNYQFDQTFGKRNK